MPNLKISGTLSFNSRIEVDEMIMHGGEIAGYGNSPTIQTKMTLFTGNINTIKTATLEVTESALIQCNYLSMYQSQFTTVGQSEVVLDGIPEVRVLEGSVITINNQATMTSKSHSVFVTHLRHREPDAVPGYIHLSGNVVAQKNLTLSCPLFNDGGTITVTSDRTTIVVHQGSTSSVGLPNGGNYVVNGENCQLIFDGLDGDGQVGASSNFPASTSVLVTRGTMTINLDTTEGVLDATFSMHGGHLVLRSDSSSNTIKEVYVDSVTGSLGSVTLEGQNQVNINTLTIVGGDVKGRTGKITKFVCYGHGEVTNFDIEEIEVEEFEIKGTFAITGVMKVSSRLESYDETHRHPPSVTFKDGTIMLMSGARGTIQTSIDFLTMGQGEFVIAGELSILQHSVINMGADFNVQSTGQVIVARHVDINMQSLYLVEGEMQVGKSSQVVVEGPSSLSSTSVFGKPLL